MREKGERVYVMSYVKGEKGEGLDPNGIGLSLVEITEPDTRLSHTYYIFYCAFFFI